MGVSAFVLTFCVVPILLSIRKAQSKEKIIAKKNGPLRFSDRPAKNRESE
jgi:hypothetical protein